MFSLQIKNLIHNINKIITSNKPPNITQKNGIRFEKG